MYYRGFYCEKEVAVKKANKRLFSQYKNNLTDIKHENLAQYFWFDFVSHSYQSHYISDVYNYLGNRS